MHIKKIILLALFTPLLTAAVYQGNGIKVGEAGATEAIVWTRLTQRPDPHFDGREWIRPGLERLVEDGSNQLPEDARMQDMAGTLLGADGMLRVSWWPEGEQTLIRHSEWLPADAQRDHTRQFQLTELTPQTAYRLQVHSRDASGQAGATVDGAFRTAPAADQAAPVHFVVTTCHRYPKRDSGNAGLSIYPLMQQQQPDFFVHTGDILYYDKPKEDVVAYSPALARFHWNRWFGCSDIRDFHNQVASYFIKDDHDTLKNDCWPGQHYGALSFEQGLAIFREQVPMGELTYRTQRWGRDLQIWLVEGRDYRSPNTMRDGPEKTIWGAEQMAWFQRTVQASDASFKILLSPTPVLGPDRPNKMDSHANDKGFQYEGDLLRAFLAQEQVVVINGDRHWQYVSHDPEQGLWEFGCGPGADRHAGGYRGDHPLHRYFKVQGGWLGVQVERQGDQPRAIFRHYDAAGVVAHEEVLGPEL